MILNFYTINAFINFLISITLGLLVLFKNRKGSKNIGFFALALTVACWNLSYFFWQNVTDDPIAALFWLRFLSVSIILIGPAYMHFVLAVTETIEKKGWLLTFIYAFFYIFVFSAVTGNFVKEVRPIMTFPFWPVATPMFSAYVFCFIICIIYSSYLLIKKYRASTGIIKIQIKYVSMGMIIAAVSGWTIFLPWYGIPVPPIGNAFVPAYIITIAYTITRHRLMNIKILLRNILFHFGIAFLLYALFYGTAFSYKIIFGDVLTPESYLVGLFLAPILAIILYSASSFFSVFINKYFFPSIYSYQQAIKDASYSLSHHTGLEQIAYTLVSTIKKTVQPNGVAVLFVKNLGSDNSCFEVAENSGLNTPDLLSIDHAVFSEYFQKNQGILTRESLEQLIQEMKDGDERKILHEVENQLHKYNIFVCAPLKNKFDLLGIIVTNSKQYENAYFQEDFDLLETLSHYAQIAVENSFLYKQIEKENSYLKKVSAEK